MLGGQEILLRGFLFFFFLLERGIGKGMVLFIQTFSDVKNTCLKIKKDDTAAMKI